MRDFICQTLFIQCAQLFQQNDGIPVKTVLLSLDFDMRRELRLLNLGRDGCDDDRWAESVANVILDDEYGAKSTLFGSNDWR